MADEIANQLFIRGLSYSSTEEDLTKLFEDIGPLKNVSIAKDAEGKSRGFGFVKFSFDTDAQEAIKRLQGTALHGRKLTLEVALKKEKEEGRGRREIGTTEAVQRRPKHEPKKLERAFETKPVDPSKIQTQSSQTTEQIGSDRAESSSSISRGRQVIIFGIPIDVTKRILSRVVDKICRKALVEFVTEDHDLSASLAISFPPGKIAVITAKSRIDAQKIATALDSITVANLGLSKYQLKGSQTEDSEDGLLSTKAMSHRRIIARLHSEITPVTHRKKACRAIIRNLSYQAREEHILDRLSIFGPIAEVDLPLVSREVTSKRKGATRAGEQNRVVETHRGFAFVTWLCEKDAHRAVESSGADGKPLKICNRDVAVDFSVSKSAYQRFNQDSEQESAKADPETGDAEEGDEDEPKEDSEEDEHEDDDEEEEEDVDEDHDGDNNDSSSESDDSDNDGSAMDEESSREERVKPQQKTTVSDVQEGKTLFLRNLGTDTTAEDIKQVLQRYGRLEFVVLVKDKVTGLSRGSAFAKFSDQLSVSHCLRECEVVGLEVNNKIAKINLAVDKASAEGLKDGQVQGRDRRNLYLANEGLVVSKDDGDMPASDKEKRQRTQVEKKKKLQNPLFYVSHERLSIRNLKKTLKDHDIRVLCLKAVKAGLRKQLVSLEDMSRLQQAQGAELFGGSKAPDAVQLRSLNTYSSEDLRSIPEFNPKQCVRTAKVILDLDERGKQDRATWSQATSKGFAFVEFYHHAHALACLRELNNNPAYEEYALNTAGSTRSRLIAEFSVEDIRKVKSLKMRVKNSQKFGTTSTEPQVKKGIKRKVDNASQQAQNKRRRL